MSDDITKVIFRKWPDGDVIAIFPEEPAIYLGWNCMSYMHIGQHGAASYEIIRWTRPARDEDYSELKAELEAEPYNYKLKVYTRITPAMRTEFERRQKELK